MGGSFACPECGNALTLKGMSPGRQIRCGWCETWVEVPFLPRGAGFSGGRRSRRRRPRWIVWTWAGLAAAACLILLLGAGRMMRSRGRERVERTVSDLVALAEADEKSGQVEKAAAEMAEAIKAAEKLVPPLPDRLEELRRYRDRLARSAAESRLAAALKDEPGAAIAVYKDLLSRTWREPALEGLEGTIRTRLEQTRRTWAESDAADAKRAGAEGRPNDAITLCERLIETTEELPSEVQNPLREQANALVAGLIEQRGVTYDPALGQFTLGTGGSYQSELNSLFDDLLRQRGYVPRRAQSYWRALWDSQAPFRVAIEVTERLEGSYIQSRNRLSFLTVAIMLKRATGASVWQSGPVAARTQPSIPSLSAFTASRLVTDERRSGEFEQLLYKDARATLLAKLTPRLRTLPDYRPPPR